MNDPNQAIRAFIALEVPPAAQAALSRTIDRLQAVVPNGVRWVDPSGIHLTLKFLGDISPSRVDRIIQATRSAVTDAGAGNLDLRLSHLGLFPNARQPRVLWAGIDGDLAPLRSLQSRLDDAVSTLGFHRERRPFSPHLTLGRVRDGAAPEVRRRVASAIESIEIEPGDGWRADSLCLFRSALTPTGAIYSVLGAAPLHKP